ncbi:hypothetical protein, partial [Segatella bryantii]|uniref:hypothetical protein n=1 Tax=Segatella bryantii TaxID=77095 RepID=UPI00241D4480
FDDVIEKKRLRLIEKGLKTKRKKTVNCYEQEKDRALTSYCLFYLTIFLTLKSTNYFLKFRV